MISLFLRHKKNIILKLSTLLILFFIIQPFAYSHSDIVKDNHPVDSAKIIMRKAITQVKKNQHPFSQYQTEIYCKTTFNIHKISKLFNSLLTSKEEAPLKSGDILVREEISKTAYQEESNSANYVVNQPTQTVLSFTSSFPEKIENFDLERLALYDIYNDTCHFISPLSQVGSETYYYSLEKVYHNSFGKNIFHIHIIPKHKNPYAFSGYVDIMDSTWQVCKFDLSATMNYGVGSFSFTIKKYFGEIENSVRIDSCFVTGKMKTAGFKADIQLFTLFTNDGIPKEYNSVTTLQPKRFSFGFMYLDEILTLNPVDGFKVILGGHFDWTFKNQTVWHNSAKIGYAFTSKQISFFVSTGYEYLPKKNATFSIFGGRESADFNALYGVHPVLNLMATLFVKDNYNYMYDRTHIGIEHQIEAFNGFDTRVSFSYEQRKELFNKNDYSFFYRETKSYLPNIPDNPYIANQSELITGGNAALLEVELSYTPHRHYRLENRKKIFLYSNFPTFSILWRKGITHLFNSATNFDYLEFSVFQKIRKNSLRNFTYRFSGGWFPNHQKMHFSEFRHFPVSGFTETLGGFGEMYHTLPVYYPSTNEWMLSGFFKYEALYLAVKYIPWINKTHLTESLYFSYLNTPYTRNLMEIGYSLNNILLFVNAGFFVGFENFRYSGWCFKIAFSMPKI